MNRFRLARTWRILAYAVNMLLQRRAQYHLDRRMDRYRYSVRRKGLVKPKAKEKPLAGVFDAPVQPKMDGEDTSRKLPTVAAPTRPCIRGCCYRRSSRAAPTYPHRSPGQFRTMRP